LGVAADNWQGAIIEGAIFWAVPGVNCSGHNGRAEIQVFDENSNRAQVAPECLLGHSRRMTTFNTSKIQWRVPWHAISPDYAAKAETEIHREMCVGHVLFGRSVTAVGYRQDCDDVLFYLGESAPSFAVVHLSYQPEKDPKWPETSLFDSFDSWVEQCMIPEAEDFDS
jgi:hypothetical protein